MGIWNAPSGLWVGSHSKPWAMPKVGMGRAFGPESGKEFTAFGFVSCLGGRGSTRAQINREPRVGITSGIGPT